MVVLFNVFWIILHAMAHWKCFVEYLETASCLLPILQLVLFRHWCHWKSPSWITDSHVPVKLSRTKNTLVGDRKRNRSQTPGLVRKDPFRKAEEHGRTIYLKSNASLKPNEKNSKNAPEQLASIKNHLWSMVKRIQQSAESHGKGVKLEALKLP